MFTVLCIYSLIVLVVFAIYAFFVGNDLWDKDTTLEGTPNWLISLFVSVLWPVLIYFSITHIKEIKEEYYRICKEYEDKNAR